MSEKNELEISESQRKYWKKNVSIIRTLLIIWAAVSLGASIIFANALYNVKFFGINLAFWFSQQGAMVTFVILIFYYAWRMDKLDKEYNVYDDGSKDGGEVQ